MILGIYISYFGNTQCQSGQSLPESARVWRIVWRSLADSPPDSAGLRLDYVGQ